MRRDLPSTSDEKSRSLKWLWIFWFIHWTDPDHLSPLGHMSQCHLGIEIMWELSPPHLWGELLRCRIQLTYTIYIREESPYWWGPGVAMYPAHIGSFDPIAQFNCVSVLRNRFVVATTAYFCERYVALTVVARQIEIPNVGFRLM